MSASALALAAALLAVIAAHVTLLVSLASVAPFRALAALALPPLAPYWGWAHRLRRRVAVWCLAVLLYTVALAVVGR